MLTAAIVAACGAPTAPPPPPPVVVDAGPPMPEPVDAGPSPVPPPPKRDCALKPGQISDDETPIFEGPTKSERALDWLAARGVTTADALKWFVTQVKKAPDAENAEIGLGEASCFALPIDKEEAILCEARDGFESTASVSALGIVVRKSKPVAVLDVPIGMTDLPDEQRVAEQQLVFAPDFKSFELHDRAPTGTFVVEPPSRCEAHESMLQECAVRLASGQGSLALCPVVDDHGTRRLNRDDPASKRHPPKLYDCKTGLKEYASWVETEIRSDPKGMKELKGFLAVASKVCAGRGRWKWNGNRYVKAT